MTRWLHFGSEHVAPRATRMLLLAGLCHGCSSTQEHTGAIATTSSDASSTGGSAGSDPGASGAAGMDEPPGTGGSGGTNQEPGTGGAGGTSQQAGTGGAATNGGSSGSQTTSGVSGNAGQAGDSGMDAGMELEPFRNGPCIASADGDAAEVFARGDDQRIYRRVVTEAGAGSWAPLTDLDGSSIDNRSDLACSGATAAIHLAALGAQPAGALLHAVGLGTDYNPFVRVLETQVFLPTPSISAGNTGQLFAGVNAAGYLQATLTDGADFTQEISPTNIMNLPWSRASVARHGTPGSSQQLLAIVDSTSQVVVYEYYASSGGASWQDPVVFAPPADTEYEHAPGICTSYDTEAGSRIHLLVVAGERLWHSIREPTSFDPFTEWELAADLPLSSTPACTVTNDGALHVVALEPAGSVLHVTLAGGEFSSESLGGY